MTMLMNMPLDYAFFQLDPSGSRCELWISAGGSTQKLASGLLKPFLVNLRAAQEQISSGAQSIRLQAPSVTAHGRNSGASWFSKGTMQRFVRFVSTPEVLDRVSVVEAECQRLDEAINILARDSTPIIDSDYCVSKSSSTSSSIGSNIVEDKVSESKIKHAYSDGINSGADGSKRELLEGMKSWKIMLQREQRKALAQAVSAGFSLECMSDLIVFSDCFGAVQFREACSKFMAMGKKIHDYENLLDEMESAAEAVSASLNNSKTEIILVNDDKFKGLLNAKSPDVEHYNSLSNSVTASIEILRLNQETSFTEKSASSASSIGWSKTFSTLADVSPMQPQRRNLVREVLMARSTSSNHLENDDLKEVKVTDVQVAGEKIKLDSMTMSKRNDNKDFQSENSSISSSSCPPKHLLAQGDHVFGSSNIMDERLIPPERDAIVSTTEHRLNLKRRLSLSKRSSTLKGIPQSSVRSQNMVVVRNMNYASSYSEGFLGMKNECNHKSGDSASDESDLDTFEGSTDAKNRHRSFSVQDAIGLFEQKRRESGEVPMAKTNIHEYSTQSKEMKKPEVAEAELRKSSMLAVLRSGITDKDYKKDDDILNKAPDRKLKLTKGINRSHVKASRGSESARFFRSKDFLSGACKDQQGMKEGVLHPKTRSIHKIMPEDLASTPRISTVSRSSSRLMPSNQINNEDRREVLPATAALASRGKVVEKKKVHRKNLPGSESLTLLGSRRPKQTVSEIMAPTIKILLTEESAIPEKSAVIDSQVCDSEISAPAPEIEQYGPLEPQNQFVVGLNSIGTTIQNRHPHHSKHSAIKEIFIDLSLDSLQNSNSWGSTDSKNPASTTQIEQYSHSKHQKQSIVALPRLNSSPKHIPKRHPHQPIPSATRELFVDTPMDYFTQMSNSWCSNSDFYKRMIDKESSDAIAGSKDATRKQDDGRGYFYEYYQQKRDAKLQKESGASRAEKEAKMKAMQEVLERRKAELLCSSSNSARTICTRTEDLAKLQKSQAEPIRLEKKGREPRTEDSSTLPSKGSSFTHLQGLPISSSKVLAVKFSPNSHNSSACSEAPRPAVASKAMSRNSNNDTIPTGQLGGTSGMPANSSRKVFSQSSLSAPVDLRKDHAKTSCLASLSLLQDKLTTPKTSTGDYHHMLPGDNLSPRSKEARKTNFLVQASDNLVYSKLLDMQDVQSRPWQQNLNLAGSDLFHIASPFAQKHVFQNSNSCEVAAADPSKSIEASMSKTSMKNSSYHSVVQLPDSLVSKHFSVAESNETLRPVPGEELMRIISETDLSHKSLSKSTDASTFVDVKNFDPFRLDSNLNVQDSQTEDNRENCLPASKMREPEVTVSRHNENEEVESKYCTNEPTELKQTLARSLSFMSECSQISEAANKVGMNSSSETPQLSSLEASILRVPSGTRSSSMSICSSCTSPTFIGQDSRCSGSFQDVITVPAQSEDIPKAISMEPQKVPRKSSFKGLLNFGRKTRTKLVKNRM